MDFELWQTHTLAREVISTALRSVFIHMNINGDMEPAKIPPRNLAPVRIAPVQKPSTAETSSSSDDRPHSSTWRNSAMLPLPLTIVKQSNNRHHTSGKHQSQSTANSGSAELRMRAFHNYMAPGSAESGLWQADPIEPTTNSQERAENKSPSIEAEDSCKANDAPCAAPVQNFIPYYLRFDRRFMRSSSTGSSTETSADEHELVFLPRKRPRQSFPQMMTYNSDSTESSNGIDIEKASTSRTVVPFYGTRVSARSSDRMHTNERLIWMTSGLFTITRGKQKITEFIAKNWAVYTANVRFFVDHIRSIKHPGITRHTYSTTWTAGTTSRVIYFTIGVSTVLPRKPIQVFCTFPNGEKHRPESAERSFKGFLNGLYWARMQENGD